MKKLFFAATGLVCAAAFAVTLSVRSFAPAAGSLLSINIEALAQDEDNSGKKYSLKKTTSTCSIDIIKDDGSVGWRDGYWYDCEEDASGETDCSRECVVQ